MIKKILVLSIALFLAIGVYADKYKYETVSNTKISKATDRCRAASNKSDLDINNVRARINTGGDMWWDLQGNPKYEVPKGSGKHAMFAAALWIGGKDINGQLKVAAQRFRQAGVDFWTGPLTVDGSATITADQCNEWDKHFRISKRDVDEFRRNFKDPISGYVVPDIITNWPWRGHPELGQTNFLAPFYDYNGDDKYDPDDGDYPYYDFDNSLCPTSHVDELGRPKVVNLTPTRETVKGAGSGAIPVIGGKLVDQVLKGDETLWWVFNDKGNSHTETKGDPIGLEIRAQAFGFTTNDEINNMTFYTYEIINRSTYTLTETFFSQWVDTDLGYEKDDYVGCDVERGLGYCYNGKNVDGPSPKAYEGNPPAIGVDFFQGPYLDPDGIDNSRVDISQLSETEKSAYYKKDSTGSYILDPLGNKIVDTFLVNLDASRFKSKWTCVPNTYVGGAGINGVNFGNGIVDDERFGMRRFVYHNNESGPTGDPGNASEYYNMLRGIWKDNTPMRYGGTGYAKNSTASICDFMFPRKSDIWAWGVGCNKSSEEFKQTGGQYTKEWSEETEGNPYGDRRFMQSAGPFTLRPGAINYITVGIPFAKAETGGAMASVDLLLRVDDKCQQLFDNCFKVLDGPRAPRLVIREMDKSLILYIDPMLGDPDCPETYTEKDISIPANYITSTTVTVHVDSTKGPGDKWYYIDSTYTKEDMKAVDQFYRFEGYQIYQLRTETVSVADIGTSEDAVLIAQCDIKNFDSSGMAVGKLVNYVKSTDVDGALVPEVMVNGTNTGLFHTLKITEDKFATGNRTLVNHKKYYFAIVSYAYNEWMPFNGNSSAPEGQTTPYLRGRLGPDGAENKPIVGIPHKTDPEQNGTLIRASYGDQPQITRMEGHGNGGFLVDLTDETVNDILSKPAGQAYAEQLLYKQGYGPINVKVVDPLSVKPGNFYVAFDVKGGTNPKAVDTASWKLWSDDPTVGIDTIHSSTTIAIGGEQIIFDLGLSVSIKQDPDVATLQPIAQSTANVWTVNQGVVLGSSMIFKDSLKRWLTALPDVDANPYLNWIHSGSVAAADQSDPYEKFSVEDYNYTDNKRAIYMDPDAQFEGMLSGTWAPYRLAGVAVKVKTADGTREYDLRHMPGYYAPSDNPTVPNDNFLYTVTQLQYNYLNNVSSVKVVITSNKANWTRCPVIEMNPDVNQAQGGAKQFMLRAASSVDKEGNPDGSGTGMSWFPGYAINLETGERLNIMFGEDSYDVSGNGADMMWNPVTTGFGGKHYIYVFGSNGNVSVVRLGEKDYSSPAYDEGQWAYNLLKSGDASTRVPAVYANVMYVNMPILSSTEYAFKNPAQIPTDVTIRLNVRKSYGRYLNHAEDVNRFAASNPINDNWPLYKFTTSNMAVQTNDKEVAKSALDMINVVPNPYYSYSRYETSQVDNRVRIVNIPQKCNISIYTVNGTLIRQFKVDTRSIDKTGSDSYNSDALRNGDPVTSIDWDLKNHANIPISGGLYIIHVKSDAGEKIVKFFATMRPTDLSNF